MANNLSTRRSLVHVVALTRILCVTRVAWSVAPRAPACETRPWNAVSCVDPLYSEAAVLPPAEPVRDFCGVGGA